MGLELSAEILYNCMVKENFFWQLICLYTRFSTYFVVKFILLHIWSKDAAKKKPSFRRASSCKHIQKGGWIISITGQKIGFAGSGMLVLEPCMPSGQCLFGTCSAHMSQTMSKRRESLWRRILLRFLAVLRRCSKPWTCVSISPSRIGLDHLERLDGGSSSKANERWQRAKARYHAAATWVKSAWHDIPEDMSARSFLKCGISNTMDGTQDDAIYDEDIPTA